MESSIVVREAKQINLRPSADLGAAGCDDDLISGLNDDVLLRILRLVANARDVVRTDAFSRRWRGLWMRVSALRFRPWQWSEPDVVERFIAFVSGVLALRARSRDAIEHLVISFPMNQVCCDEGRGLRLLSVRAAEDWMRYAVQQGVKSFAFEFDLPSTTQIPTSVVDDNNEDDDEEEAAESERMPVMDLDQLPGSEKLETMHLELCVRVRLPSTAVFPSLEDLTLQSMAVTADSGHLLARLLSSACCPRLRKLHMCCVLLPAGMNELLLDAGMLLELSLHEVSGLEMLELRTPSLRTLKIVECYELEALKVSAPSLEELTSLHNSLLVDIDGDLSCVESLKLDLFLGRDIISDHGNNVYLLQHCSSARHLDLSLTVIVKDSPDMDVIKGRIPHLHQVTSLKVHISGYFFGESVACLLTIFTNLMHICLDFDCYDKRTHALCSGVGRDSDFICDGLDHWKTHKISFFHLQEAEFMGLSGTVCELRFLQFVLASATQLQKVVVNFNPLYLAGVKREDFHHMLLDGGTWTDRADKSSEWRPPQSVKCI